MVSHVYNDGGREAAGYKGEASDCAVRAISIAVDVSGASYKKVYKDLFKLSGESPRNGVSKKVIRSYLEQLGWVWVPTMRFATGCQVHLREDELPKGVLILSLSKHTATMIDGVLHDTYDCSREGNRCVYGYYKRSENA